MATDKPETETNRPEMGLFGIGPHIALAGAVGFAFAWCADRFFGVALRLDGLYWAAASMLSLALLAAGLFFWIGAVLKLGPDYASGKLITTGVYARTRNPMYAAFIIFLAPALALILNNLACLAAPPLMYAVFDHLIEREEKFLLEKFGEEYRLYAERTPQLLPKLLR